MVEHSVASVAWIVCQVFVSGIVMIISTLAFLLHRKHRRYAHIPGPPRSSFWLGNVPDLRAALAKGTIIGQYILDSINTHGQTIHFFLAHKPFICTVNRDFIKSMYVGGVRNSKSELELRDLKFLYGCRFFGNSLVTEPSHDQWSKQRTLLNPAFNRKELKNRMLEFNIVSDQLIAKLHRISNDNKQAEMYKEICRLTLDTIGKVSFNMDINCIGSEVSDFHNALNGSLDGHMETLRNPLVKINPFRRKYRESVRRHIMFIRNTGRRLIEERILAAKEGRYAPDDILAHVVRLEDHNIPLETLIDHFVLTFIAGQGTTASLITFMVLHIARRTEVLKRLRAELAEVLGDRTEVTLDDAGSFTYMTQVINEVLRLYTPAIGSLRCVDDDQELGGYKIPGKSIVFLSQFASHRYEPFHEDALNFDPERFAADKPPLNPYSYFPFVQGPRACIGRAFAKIECKVFIAKFLQHFDFELDPVETYEIKGRLSIRPKGEVLCNLKPKRPSPDIVKHA